MFIWDFVADTVFDQILDWVNAKIVGFLSQFFGAIAGMGIELFEFAWVKAIILFFNYFAWALFAVGFILAVFETAIAYQNGQGNIKNTFLNILKGFIATSLITLVPIELFKFTVTLHVSFSTALSQITATEQNLGVIAKNSIDIVGSITDAGFFSIFLLISLGYCIFKVFFANLKRGGILLTQIAVGSLYMLSVPRGFTDGFVGWCKQVVALCLTTFLQSIFLIAGLMVFRDNFMIGLGLMFSANEIPRIADHFGLDTSARGNIMGSVYAVQSVVSLTRSILAK